MAAKSELELREILLTTGLVQPLRTESKGKRVSAVCRQLPGQEKAWLRGVEELLRMAEEVKMPLHICRQYFLKNGSMVFGWHISVEGEAKKDLEVWLDQIRKTAQLFEPDAEPEAVPAPQLPAQVTAPTLSAPTLTPNEAAAREAKQTAYLRAHTGAMARPPGPEANVTPPPAGFESNMKVIFRGKAKDSKNRTVPVIIEEFPLPHTFVDDMNKPNDKGRGAKTL